MSWKDKRLGDVLTLKRGYDLTEAQRRDGSVPVVSSSGVTGWHDAAMVEGPGVVTGRYGTMGEVFYIESDFWPHNTALYVQDFKGNDRRFIAYLLKLILRGAGSDKAAVPGVNRNELHERRVRVPGLDVQRRLVDQIEPIDDLIENNSRRIVMLEESARLLYREWFVHLRFPGHEHVKVVNGVPEGWERTLMPDLIAINPTERIDRAHEAWYIPMAALSETGMIVERGHFERRTSHTAVKFRNGDVLLARITPCLENGKTAFVYFLNENEVACGSTEFIVLRGRKVSPHFVYCLSRTYDFREFAIKSMIGSSGRQRVQTSCFSEYLVPLPSDSLLREFDCSVEPMFKQVVVLQRENEKLSEARDLLLPRLMSGEIQV